MKSIDLSHSSYDTPTTRELGSASTVQNSCVRFRDLKTIRYDARSVDMSDAVTQLRALEDDVLVFDVESVKQIAQRRGYTELVSHIESGSYTRVIDQRNSE